MARKIRISTPEEMALLRQRVTETRSCIERFTNRLEAITHEELPSITTQFNQTSATLRKQSNENMALDLISERERLSTEMKALKKEETRLNHSLKGCLALNNILSLELDISEANVEMSGGNAGTATSKHPTRK
ncbi:uncharacterized protein LAJ45_09881 [Morchella importuna]|uniref:uncharacterized protein n=1 Tax=Morchella importuna TaxID=1174673 RepID=UPI001E8DC0D6|nr:uncharacterized protein LAJ45_09881 [Morchella importuna]KAH8146183.1 hypothetical protein LAJ45_09881 [Morchella importuna]